MKPGSYNDAAAKVTAATIADDAADASPHRFACAARGCPIRSGITVGRTRLCFVHLRVDDRGEWDGVTARINNRHAFVAASLYLRQARGEPRVIAQLPADVLATIPEDARRSVHAALSSIESMLAAECTADVAVTLGSSAAADDARDLARSIADEWQARIIDEMPAETEGAAHV